MRFRAYNLWVPLLGLFWGSLPSTGWTEDSQEPPTAPVPIPEESLNISEAPPTESQSSEESVSLAPLPSSEEAPPMESSDAGSTTVVEVPVNLEEAPSSADVDTQISAVPVRRNARVPAYTLTRPAWGVEIMASLRALGGKELNSAQAGIPTRALQISAEYQFPFLQSIGVLSMGPSLGVYPIVGDTSVTSSPASLWELGGQVRYQARFFREQILVPVAGFEAQYFNYRFLNGTSGALMAKGPLFGLMFLLNWLEPNSAAEFYVEHAVSRSYLLAEFRLLTGSDANLSFSGQSLFFGLRLEF